MPTGSALLVSASASHAAATRLYEHEGRMYVNDVALLPLHGVMNCKSNIVELSLLFLASDSEYFCRQCSFHTWNSKLAGQSFLLIFSDAIDCWHKSYKLASKPELSNQTKFICHIYNHIKQWNASNIHVAFHGQAVVLHEHYCHCCYTEPSFPEGLLSYKREVSVLGCNGYLIILKMKTLMHPKVHGCFGSAERVHIKLPCFSAGTSLSADLNINIPLKHQ